MSISRKHILLFGVALIALAVGLLFFAHLRAKARLETYRQQLLAAGEKLEISDYVPAAPTNHNGAQELLRISASIPRIEHMPSMMKIIHPGVARVAWKQDILPENSTGWREKTNVWPIVETYFEGREHDLAKIQNQITNSAFQFDLDYGEGLNIPLPHLSKVKTLEQQLSTAMVLHLRKGRHDDAFQALMAAVTLPRIYTNEPLMPSQAVRLACVQIAASASWEALQSKDWTEHQLAALQKNWMEMQIVPSCIRAMQMERAMATPMFREIRKDAGRRLTRKKASEGILSMLGLSQEDLVSPAEMTGWLRWKWFSSYDDEIEYCQTLQHAGAIINSAPENGTLNSPLRGRSNPVCDFCSPEPNWSDGIAPMFRPSVDRFIRRFVHVHTLQQLTVTAIALERFHLQHSKYPERLDQLFPNHLTQMPIDFYNGEVLRYEPLPNRQFRLHAIGPALKVDGSDHRSEDDLAAFVWPRAATDEEVKAFEERELKPNVDRYMTDQ